MATPAIIFKMSFSYNWHIGGYDFLEYMNRPEAFERTNHLRDEYKDFIDYMSNKEKSDGLFDSVSDLLDRQEIEQYRQWEEQSQSEGCPKYFGVISFDNDFLKNNGVLSNDGRLDVGLLKQLTREGMDRLISTSQKLEASNVYWNAAIHTNTDNIHIHYALCEHHRLEDRQKIYRDKDMIEQAAFNALKSRVLNRIVGKDFVTELTRLEREVLLKSIKQEVPNRREQLAELAAVLPQEGGWQYNRPKMKPYLPRINECVDSIIHSSPSLTSSYEEYIRKLDERTITIKEQYYGSNKQQLYLAYKRNKLLDFYARAGNIVLNAIKENREQLEKLQKSAHLSEGGTFGGAPGGIPDDTQIFFPEGTELPAEPKKRPSFRGRNLSGYSRWQQPRPYNEVGEEQNYHLSEERHEEYPFRQRFAKTLSSNGYYMSWNRPYKQACELIYSDDSDEAAKDKAARLLLSESNKGNVLAMCELAKMEATGDSENNISSDLYKKALDGFKEILSAADDKRKAYLQYRIGKMYLYGLGTDIDENEAFGYISTAAEQGNRYAQFTLGNMYRYGSGTPIDNESALKWYISSSDKGQPFASYAAASLMEQLGNFPQEDIYARYAQALEAFLKLDKEQSANDEVFTKIGMMYLKGKGTEENTEAAEKYLTKAAKLKNERAIYSLGCLYYKQDKIDKALEYLNRSAEQDNPYAAYRLGKIYSDKEKELYNFDSARVYFEKAAELGFTTSYLSLGKLYSDPDDEEHFDIKKAIEMYETAYADPALKTFTACKLAKLYLTDGETKNTHRAIEVLEGVPDNAYASFMLGKLYSDPDDEEHFDIKKAIEMYETAYADPALKTFAACKLAKLYLTDGETKNTHRAIEALEGVPDNAYASFMLGKLYSDPDDEEHFDIKKAIEMYEIAYADPELKTFAACKLAKLYLTDGDTKNTHQAIEVLEGVPDNAYASFMLGKLYSDPDDEEHFDIKKAINAYEAAYSDDDLRNVSAYRLARLLLEKGENRNELRAVELLSSITDTDSNAAFILGKLLYNGGETIKQNRSQGLKLIRQAAEEGNISAASYLEHILRPKYAGNTPPPSVNLQRVITSGALAARHTYLMMSRIYRDMERHHAQALSEFEREQAQNEFKSRVY